MKLSPNGHGGRATADGCSEQNDSVRPFESHAQRQRVRPEQNASYGKTRGANSHCGQWCQQIPFPDVSEDSTRKQADCDYKCGLLNSRQVAHRDVRP